jgi:hypothetical protein
MPSPRRVLLTTALVVAVAGGVARADDPEEDAPSAAPTVYWRTNESPHFRAPAARND